MDTGAGIKNLKLVIPDGLNGPHLYMQLIKSDSENYWHGTGVPIKYKNKNLYKNRIINMLVNPWPWFAHETIFSNLKLNCKLQYADSEKVPILKLIDTGKTFFTLLQL